jgi:hypothetical protein
LFSRFYFLVRFGFGCCLGVIDNFF